MTLKKGNNKKSKKLSQNYIEINPYQQTLIKP